ncbi:MAG: hypothetical protein AAGG59_00485 [Bacteroidota bacterium]
MKIINRYIVFGLTVAIAWSCTYDEPEMSQPTSGTADFTKMVSVGNSLTAGFMDGALYNQGQMNSFPALLAMQMELVGGGEFNQPDINSDVGFSGLASDGTTPLGRLRLVGSVPTPIVPGEFPGAFAGDKSALNNFGVPGITLGTALIPNTGTPGDDLENGLYTRFASSPGTSTVIGDAAAALADGGTFFTFWLGNNDILGYATGGAANEAIFTDLNTFSETLNLALGAMLAAAPDAEGVVANIPDVLSIPFFKLVPYNSIPLDATTAAGVNIAYGEYNAGLAAALGATLITQEEHDRRVINFVEGDNGYVITDDELTDVATLSGGMIPIPNLRQTAPTDLVPLTVASVLGTLVDPDDPNTARGVGVPLGDESVVTPAELATIQSRTEQFNQLIADAVDANSSQLVLFDANTLLQDLVVNGASINGSALDASLIPPFGAFSTDGVHPNSRGYAYLTNEMIEVINSKFGANIPELNPNDYPGNALPE